MNFKKVLNFLGLFILGINLLFTTEFAENLEAPKEIKEILKKQTTAPLKLTFLSYLSFFSSRFA